MTDRPRLSVIVPAYQAEALLPDTLGALRACATPSVGWELILVDDGSTDATAQFGARYADRVVRLSAPPGGPAAARNAGAVAARGDWLLFVDADVRVHPDVLQRVVETFRARPEATGVFGSYDAAPAAPGVVSRYRNLLHRYVHQRGAGPAETFWGGLGAIRADAFRAAGGFNPGKYRRPQIEDIEFGYRLRERGALILLDPALQGTHLKGWTLGRMLRTDFRDRAIPWMRLLLEQKGHPGTLNVTGRERVRVFVAGLALAALGMGVILRDLRLTLVGILLLLGIAGSNGGLYRWFAEQEGWPFLLAAVPLHLLYYLTNAVAGSVAFLIHAVSPRRLYVSPPPAPVFGTLHKRAFGIATGTVAALLVFLATAVYLLRDPHPGLELGLLSQFFTGYSVSWSGAVIGSVQAWIAGFVMGWFLAFTRNLMLAALLFLGRSRAELEQARDFLDHI